MTAGVMHPEIIGTECLWLGATRRSHGDGAPGGSVGSGDRAIVAFGHVLGSMSLRTVVAHVACFVCAIQQPSPPWVVWVGRRASGSVPVEDGAFTGW